MVTARLAGHTIDMQRVYPYLVRRIVLRREKNMQTAGQAMPHRGGNPNWVKGVSGNPRGSESAAARRARVAAKVEVWVKELGGKVGVLERDLLQRAAEMSLLRPRRHEDLVRVTNTISKLLAQAGFRTDRPRKRKTMVAALTGEGEVDGEPFSDE